MANGVSPSSTSGQDTLSAIGKELKQNPPAVVNATRRKFGVAKSEKQRTAILLSKGRAAGVAIPSASPKNFSK